MGTWTRVTNSHREFDFLPLLHDPSHASAGFPPMALRFGLAARWAGLAPSGRIVQMHRFETAYGFPRPPDARQALFLHNHPPHLGTSGSDRAWRRIPGLFDRLSASVIEGVDAVVALDPQTPAYLDARWPERRAAHRSFRPWADPEFFHPGTPKDRARCRTALRAELGLAEDAEVVVCPIRLSRQKDPKLLGRSFARLAQRRASCALVVFGEGAFEAPLRALLDEAGVGGRAHLLPSRARRHLADALRGADALACTSHYEAGPRMILEALACGCPVVSTEVGLAPELLAPDPRRGLLVAGRDAAAVAAAIEEVLDRPEDPEGATARAAAVHAYTPERQLEPVFELYRGWLAGDGPVPSEMPRG